MWQVSLLVCKNCLNTNSRSITVTNNGGWGVKFTLVQALRLCIGRTVHTGSRGIGLPFHDHGTRRGWGVSVTPRPLFTPGKDPVPIAQEAGWAPGPVLRGAENLVPHKIRSPDRPARNQSLYRLSYRAYIPIRMLKIKLSNYEHEKPLRAPGGWGWRSF